ncbi:actin nucleation factor [Homalodisca vitripennis]|nr:actin nucleation factor [Homalodisca vitripennis]
MAADVQVTPRKCRLDENECVSLLDILISFNAPINEEHAWALCYQCAKCFKNALQQDRGSCKVVTELEQILLHRDGYVHANTIFAGGGISNNAVRPKYFRTSILSAIIQQLCQQSISNCVSNHQQLCQQSFESKLCEPQHRPHRPAN